MSKLINTVLGDIEDKDVGATLPHEHICCYSEYAYTMYGSRYLDKGKLLDAAVGHLRKLKEDCGIKTFVDCTAVNIGRDIPLLKEVSRQSGVNIVCSTGFYYTEESLLGNTSVERLADYMIADAAAINAGVIKCAVEAPEISPYLTRVLKAVARAQFALRLPIVMHTNAINQNGAKALKILLSEGVPPQAITVGHLSDTEDLDYVKKIAQTGCYIALDRLGNTSEEYVSRKVSDIMALCEAGYSGQILLSHDALVFNGFDAEPVIKDNPRFCYCSNYILPRLPAELAEQVTVQNPLKMLCCE